MRNKPRVRIYIYMHEPGMCTILSVHANNDGELRELLVPDTGIVFLQVTLFLDIYIYIYIYAIPILLFPVPSVNVQNDLQH